MATDRQGKDLQTTEGKTGGTVRVLMVKITIVGNKKIMKRINDLNILMKDPEFAEILTQQLEKIFNDRLKKNEKQMQKMPRQDADSKLSQLWRQI